MKKQALCFALALCLLLALLPGTARAAEEFTGPILQVSLGETHSAAIKTDGSLWTWGWNYFGQLGDGTTIDRSSSVKIMDNVAAVSLGSRHSAALKTDGSLWTWGLNKDGELGDGTNTDRNTPVKVMDNVTVVCLGWYQSAAITADGALWIWGNNTLHQLGDGTNMDRNTPMKIMDNVVAVSLGFFHSAAIKTDGSLWTWGHNGHGQLGHDITTGYSAPTKIMDNVTDVCLGEFHSAAIKTDGSLWTWGLNDYGQLGDGTTTDRSTPVKIMDNVVAVSLGGDHNAAIVSDDSLWVWGNNDANKLGDGTTKDRSTPVKIMDNVTAVSLGGKHSAVIKTDGSLWTWGDNKYGQLGDGTTTSRSTPVQIAAGGALPATSVALPDATQYAPYRYAFSGGMGYSLTKGKLPAGLSLGSDGVLSGSPTDLGVFSFTVTAGSGAAYACRLSVLWAGGVDVEKQNESGYGFVETATDDGRVHDQFVTSTAELKPQTMHCEGDFSEFYALYLDAQKLTRNMDYTAENGSTRITLTDKTLANAGSGTHVLTAEFHTKTSSGAQTIKYTTQKYTITGIPGKNVNVMVKGVPVVWTDAQPYVNKDSRTMVPFRAIADALGLTVEWDGTTREAIFSNGSKTIYFPLDSETARTSTGANVTMDTAAISVNGRSYAPVRYLAEFFGYTVTWDGKTRTVGIS